MAESAEKSGKAHRCPRCGAPIYTDEQHCHYHGLVEEGPPAPRSLDWLPVGLCGVLMIALALVAATHG